MAEVTGQGREAELESLSREGWDLSETGNHVIYRHVLLVLGLQALTKRYLFQICAYTLIHLCLSLDHCPKAALPAELQVLI